MLSLIYNQKLRDVFTHPIIERQNVHKPKRIIIYTTETERWNNVSDSA